VATECSDVDFVVSCLGASVIPSVRNDRRSFSDIDVPANLKLLKAAEQAQIRRFVYVSVFADGRLQDNDFVRGHEQVVRHIRSSNLDYCIIRPTGFFSSLVRIMREPSMGLLPQCGNGDARTNPIHEADLAEFCADALCADGAGLEYNVGGPEILSRRQISDLVHQSGPLGRTVTRVPVSTLRAGGLFLGPFNRRVSQLMTFIADVLSDDFIAPEFGSRTLERYLASEA